MAHTQTKKQNLTASITLDKVIIANVRLHGRLIAAGDRFAPDLGLNSARWSVIAMVRDQPKTVAQIARDLELKRQSVQRVVDALADQQVLKLIDNPNHRRAKLAKLTPAGADKLRRLMVRQAKWVRELASPFDLEDLNTTLRTIHKLLESLPRR